MVITSFRTLLLLLDGLSIWAHQGESFQARKTVADSIVPIFFTPIVLPDREIERSPDIHSGCFFTPKCQGLNVPLMILSGTQPLPTTSREA